MKTLFKRVLIFTTFAFLLGISISCNKNEASDQDQFPEWLRLKIANVIPDQNLCEMTDVTIYKYKGDTYYNIYCMIWSCMFCQFFDEEGNRPDWDQKTWNDFSANQRVVKKVKACEL
jgi:hypothetical protein